ncbi:MAG: hypothetical protein M1161_01055 [Candidatus Thermoplasmatota archaeon]|nr:hypothetical protein [Candidatus Thermoplasmatota archaeon]
MMKKTLIVISFVVAVMMSSMFSAATATSPLQGTSTSKMSVMNVSNFYPGSLIGIPQGYTVTAVTSLQSVDYWGFQSSISIVNVTGNSINWNTLIISLQGTELGVTVAVATILALNTPYPNLSAGSAETDVFTEVQGSNVTAVQGSIFHFNGNYTLTEYIKIFSLELAQLSLSNTNISGLLLAGSLIALEEVRYVEHNSINLNLLVNDPSASFKAMQNDAPVEVYSSVHLEITGPFVPLVNVTENYTYTGGTFETIFDVHNSPSWTFVFGGTAIISSPTGTGYAGVEMPTTINFATITVETGLVSTSVYSGGIGTDTIEWQLLGGGTLSISVGTPWVNVNGNPVTVGLSADNNEVYGQLST